MRPPHHLFVGLCAAPPATAGSGPSGRPGRFEATRAARYARRAVTVRFFRNRAGRRLAYAVDGVGTPLVFPPWWVSHLERQAEDPPFRRFFEALARRFRVVRYDRLGVGMSDRRRRSFTFTGELADLAALVDHLGAPVVHLFGSSFGGPLAVAYAALHPRRVGKVVLYGTYAQGAALAPRAVRRAIGALVRSSWGLGSSALTDLFHPGADAATRRRYVVLQRAAADAETAAALLELHYALDARRYLAAIRAPVLVLHRRGDRAIPYRHGRELAARVPDATLVTLEGIEHMPWEGDAGAVQDAAIAFLDGGDRERRGEARPPGPELRRDGEVWSLRFEGRGALLRDCKGVADLARLVAAPGEEVHVFDLLRLPAGERRDRGSAEPALDRRALASYRRRLAEIDAAIAEAEGRLEGGSAGALAREREALLDQIAADTGLGGRPRRLNDPVERARKAVTARIRDAIRRIGRVDPALGRHLEASVSTGVRCTYAPRGESPGPT